MIQHLCFASMHQRFSLEPFPYHWNNNVEDCQSDRRKKAAAHLYLYDLFIGSRNPELLRRCTRTSGHWLFHSCIYEILLIYVMSLGKINWCELILTRPHRSSCCSTVQRQTVRYGLLKWWPFLDLKPVPYWHNMPHLHCENLKCI